MKKLTNKEFLQKLQDMNIPYVPLEEYKTASTKIKWLCHKDSRHIFDARPDHIYDGRGCYYCCGYKAFVGETDLWTVNPKVASMLENLDEGYMYTAFSSHKTNWKCPNCGYIIKNKTIKTVTSCGLSCPICSDGVSYSEKFVASLLHQLKIDFEKEKTFEWSYEKRYDFYIKQYNMIIECHGLQHYEEGFLSIDTARTLKEEQSNDLFKKNIALMNGIEKYIVIDCRKSNKEYIYNSIINNELSNIFNLHKVDWDKCDEYTHKSYYMEILKYYNNGIKNPVDIAKRVDIGHRSVLDALHKLIKNGLCDYNPKKHLADLQRKRVICLETNRIYDSIKDVVKDGFSSAMVSRCCNDYVTTYRGLHWMFYDKYLLKISEDNYGKTV